jgi:hypothetical protein
VNREEAQPLARRKGKPDPIILESEVKPLPGGGYALDRTRPLPVEYGDGRALEVALREARVVMGESPHAAPWFHFSFAPAMFSVS